MSGVFRTIGPPTPSPPSECVLPTHHKAHSPGGAGGGWSIFRKTPDIGLASYSIIPLRFGFQSKTSEEGWLWRPHRTKIILSLTKSKKFRRYTVQYIRGEIKIFREKYVKIPNEIPKSSSRENIVGNSSAKFYHFFIRIGFYLPLQPHTFTDDQREFNTKRPTIVLFCVPRNLSHHMIRQARTGDICSISWE